MARIVIASASQSGRAQLSGLLASSGYNVYRACATGGELRRALNECDDGIVVLWGGAPGCAPDDLASDFGDSFRILMIARPEVLASCESQEIFRLPMPCAGNAVLGAVEMLSQLHDMRMPRRNAEEKAIVDEAKCLLMAREGLTEPEAHRMIQRLAMNSGVKMIDFARKLLEDAR